MTYRLAGAALIIAGCGGFGISMVLDEKHRERLLHRLLSALQFMQWELKYRMTPLPELLILSGKQGGGDIQKLFSQVSRELEQQVLPDVSSCVQKTLMDFPDLPRQVRYLCRTLGKSLGCFDLPGQLEGLQEAEQACRQELEKLDAGKTQRFRSYQTLGFCAGLALVILFL